MQTPEYDRRINNAIRRSLGMAVEPRRLLIYYQDVLIGSYLTEAATWERAMTDFWSNIEVEPADEGEWEDDVCV